jgi:putative secretion ATPase (PEP-CTERM system associated)
MYEKHFSFKHKPFELVPNPDLLFLSSTHKKAITCLDYGLKEKIGFILLTGEIGSGKTTIIRNFIKNLNGSVKLSRIHNTKISSEQLISMINEDFGLAIEGKNKTRLLSELNVFLIEQYSKNYQPILLIDEAQNLSPDLLEEIRLLSNLETDSAKLLQIILVGQPELKKILMLPELKQLRQRININYHIAPLTIDETAQYIKHRLTVAGNPEAIKLQEDMLPLVYQFSKGIPRLINILCDFVLLTAFVAGKEEVTVDIVREVVKDLKSNDSWNENGDTTFSQEVKKNERIDVSTIVGDVSLRLYKLEEIVNSCIQEIFTLKEKMVQLDGDMSKLSTTQNENRINELSERISMLDLISTDINQEKKNKNPQTEKQKSKVLYKLSEQIGILTDVISRLNDKIKNQ